MPLVSIAIAAFNCETSILRAIESVRAQTFSDWEVIVVDDASSDRTAEAVASAQARDPRIRLLRLSENKGPSSARNEAIKKARGDWIAVLDADDAWRTDRLATFVDQINAAGNEIIVDNVLAFDARANIIAGKLFSTLPSKLTVIDVVADTYAGSYNLGYLKPFFRRTFLIENQLLYDEGLRTGEDLVFLLECLALVKSLKAIEYSGYIYTTPVGFISRASSKLSKSVPRDKILAERLRSFADRHRPNLTPSEMAAIDDRVASLLRNEAIARFHHARVTRNYLDCATILLSSSAARRHLLDRLRMRLRVPARKTKLV